MADDQFESQVLAFERAWQAGSIPDLRRFLRCDLAESVQIRLLHELVCIDLEFRWRRGAADSESAPLRVENYLSRFPELGSAAACDEELIAEEYRVRCHWDDAPTHAEFLARFPSHAASLPMRLQEIDRELAAEGEATIEAPAAPARPASDRPSQYRPPAPRAPLPYHDFLLQELIGSGGMGKVYRALQRSLQRTVAVKFLRKSFLDDSQAVERFITEARLMARVEHAGIVTVHGLGQTPWGSYFIVMRFLEGLDLARRIQAAPIPIFTTMRWVLALCEPVEHARNRGVFHCDLKPANILLDGEDRAYLADFGLARSIADDSSNIRGLEGTAPFMAPEQVCRSRGDVGPHTDVYGLGAVFYTLLTRRPPWPERRVPDILTRVVSAMPVVPAVELDPAIPAGLSEVCARCLAKSPGDRYASAGELRHALTGWLATHAPETGTNL